MQHFCLNKGVILYTDFSHLDQLISLTQLLS